MLNFCEITQPVANALFEAQVGQEVQIRATKDPLWVSGVEWTDVWAEILNRVGVKSTGSDGSVSFFLPYPTTCWPSDTQWQWYTSDGFLLQGVVPEVPGPLTLVDLLVDYGWGLGNATDVSLAVIGINWRGDWSSTTAYAINDAVGYSGSSYVAIQAGTDNLPTDPAYWSLLAQAGAGQLSPSSIAGPPPTGFHAAGELNLDVNVVLWQCTTSGTGTAARWKRLTLRDLYLDDYFARYSITSPSTQDCTQAELDMLQDAYAAGGAICHYPSGPTLTLQANGQTYIPHSNGPGALGTNTGNRSGGTQPVIILTGPGRAMNIHGVNTTGAFIDRRFDGTHNSWPNDIACAPGAHMVTGLGQGAVTVNAGNGWLGANLAGAGPDYTGWSGYVTGLPPSTSLGVYVNGSGAFVQTETPLGYFASTYPVGGYTAGTNTLTIGPPVGTLVTLSATGKTNMTGTVQSQSGSGVVLDTSIPSGYTTMSWAASGIDPSYSLGVTSSGSTIVVMAAVNITLNQYVTLQGDGLSSLVVQVTAITSAPTYTLSAHVPAGYTNICYAGTSAWPMKSNGTVKVAQAMRVARIHTNVWGVIDYLSEEHPELAAFDTRGSGHLIIDSGLTMGCLDTTRTWPTSQMTHIFSLATIVTIRDISLRGATAASAMRPGQANGIRLGGFHSLGNLNDGTHAAAAFGGYGSSVDGLEADNMKRILHFGINANSIPVRGIASQGSSGAPRTQALIDCPYGDNNSIEASWSEFFDIGHWALSFGQDCLRNMVHGVSLWDGDIAPTAGGLNYAIGSTVVYPTTTGGNTRNIAGYVGQQVGCGYGTTDLWESITIGTITGFSTANAPTITAQSISGLSTTLTLLGFATDFSTGQSVIVGTTHAINPYATDALSVVLTGGAVAPIQAGTSCVLAGSSTGVPIRVLVDHVSGDTVYFTGPVGVAGHTTLSYQDGGQITAINSGLNQLTIGQPFINNHAAAGSGGDQVYVVGGTYNSFVATLGYDPGISFPGTVLAPSTTTRYFHFAAALQRNMGVYLASGSAHNVIRDNQLTGLGVVDMNGTASTNEIDNPGYPSWSATTKYFSQNVNVTGTHTAGIVATPSVTGVNGGNLSLGQGLYNISNPPGYVDQALVTFGAGSSGTFRSAGGYGFEYDYGIGTPSIASITRTAATGWNLVLAPASDNASATMTQIPLNNANIAFVSIYAYSVSVNRRIGIVPVTYSGTSWTAGAVLYDSGQTATIVPTITGLGLASQLSVVISGPEVGTGGALRLTTNATGAGYVSIFSGPIEVARGDSVGLRIISAPSYSSNSAATAAGLAVGTMYRNGDNLMIVH